MVRLNQKKLSESTRSIQDRLLTLFKDAGFDVFQIDGTLYVEDRISRYGDDVWQTISHGYHEEDGYDGPDSPYWYVDGVKFGLSGSQDFPGLGDYYEISGLDFSSTSAPEYSQPK